MGTMPIRTATRGRTSSQWALTIGVLALVTLVCAATFYSIPVISKPVDFLVYRYAAERLLAGGDLYSGNVTGEFMPAGGMPFTYTPFAGIFLLPTALFDWRVSYALWTLLSLGVVAWVIDRFTPHALRYRSSVVVGTLIAAALSTVVMHHIIFGQINLLLMLLVLVDTLRGPGSRLGRYVPPGLLVGIAAAVKLTPALFIVHYLLTGQWQRLKWSVIGAAGATAFAFVLLPGVSWRFWTEVLWGLDGRVGFMENGFATSGNNSLHGLIAAVAPEARALGWALAVVAAGLGLWCARRANANGHAVGAIVVVGLIAAMVSPISWIHHWVYLLPGALLLVYSTRRGAAWLVVAVTLYIAVGVGPYLGDLLIPGPPHYEVVQLSAPLPQIVLGWFLRESLLVSALVVVVALAFRPNAVATGAPFRAMSPDGRRPEPSSKGGPFS